MEAVLLFFEQMPNWQKLVWVVVCLAFSWILEGNIPLFQLRYHKWRHAAVNLVFLGTSFIINLIFGIVTVWVFLWTQHHQIGLLYLIELPAWVELIIAVLIFDFVAQYLVHYLLHKVKWMWKFHMIHHSDTKVDATTGTRHHPGDYLLREVFAVLTIMITGAPIAYYLIYRFVTIFFTYLTHANINMPVWLDKLLSWVFVTPNMHKFHHHFERPWTDTNYGNIFSVWDRLFGTFVYGDPREIRYGLDVLPDEKDEDVVYQLKVPFDNSIKTDY